ncbi:unannotated protein [freshwater metagenome]|uniref:Unannotated protein n=1 Tax=freshwater metagenome TaxID=449393 RepID=A0A6J6F9J6_9ZZZZ
MGIKGNQWGARLASLTLLVAILTAPQIPNVVANTTPTRTPLTVIGEDRISSSSIRLILSSSGGSGTGAVTFAVKGSGCSIDPTTLVLSTTSKTICVVTATKAASAGFNAETSVSKSFEFPRPFPKSILIFSNTVFTGISGTPIVLGTLGGDQPVTYSVSGQNCSIKDIIEFGKVKGQAVVASAPTICRVTARSVLGKAVTGGSYVFPYVSVYRDFTFAAAPLTPAASPTPTPTPVPKPTSGVITQPSPVSPPTTSGNDCSTNPSSLCGTAGTPVSPLPLPAPTLIASPAPAPTLIASPAPAPTLVASPAPAPTLVASPAPTQKVSFVEVLCFDTYPASNNPKTPVTATIATRVVESLANSQICPEGMTRKINQKPVFAEAGIFLSSDKKQINYSPAKDNSAGAGNRLERFFACNTQISMSPKRPDIPKTTTTISRTLGDDELNCPKGSTFVATVFYYGYKTIKGQGYGGLGGQWPSWTYSSQPTKQKTSFGGKCAFVGQVGFWESSEKHVLVCRPDAKSGQLTWTQ